MPFNESAAEYITAQPKNDPLRITLEYLIIHAMGRRNAIPIERVLTHLARRKVRMSKEQFQTTILKKTRAGDIFIGSSNRGVFIIETEEDARTMDRFYAERIQAEQTHRQHLRGLAKRRGWPM